MINYPRAFLLAAVLLLASGRAAVAQPAVIATLGNPPALTITTAVAGSDPTSVTNSSTTYTTLNVQNGQPQKITAKLNSNMPAGVTLTVTLSVDANATSSGAVALDITARNVVISINANQTAKTITYQLSALPSAGVIASQTRTVTFTILDYP